MRRGLRRPRTLYPMKAAICKVCKTAHWSREPHAAPFHMVSGSPKDQVALPLAAKAEVVSQSESVTLLKPISKQERWKKKHAEQHKAHRREYMKAYRQRHG